MSDGPQSLPSRGGSPPRALGRPRQTFPAQPILGRVAWTPPRPRPLTDIPGLANLPIQLDGDASLAISQHVGAIAGPATSSPRLVRRRATRNSLRAGVSTGTGSSRPISTSVGANGLVTRFGNFHFRSGAGATPPLDNVPELTPASPSPSSSPAPPPPQQQQQQWPIPPIRTAADIARAAQARTAVRTKQSLTDRFRALHFGPMQWIYWDRDDRRPIWAQIPMPPKQGSWPGHEPLQPGEELERLVTYQMKLARDRPAPGGVRRVFDRIRRRLGRTRGGGGGAGFMGRLRGRRSGTVGDEETEQRLVSRLNTRLRGDFEPAGIRFKRRLGQGGFGAVFLFEMVAERGVNYPIVVKGSTREQIDDVDAFDAELNHLNSMNGASHFIQRLYLQDLPLPAAGRRRRIRMAARSGLAAVREMFKQTGEVVDEYAELAGITGDVFTSSNIPIDPGPAGGDRGPWTRRRPSRPGSRQFLTPGVDCVPGYTAQELEELRLLRFHLDNARNIIVLENMPRGDIKDLINKLVEKKKRLSNRALWTIFECLFKGCVGMATPRRFHEEGVDADAHAMAAQDETVLEWLHDGTRVPPRPMVHFDLDPQNALIGNFGEAGGPHEHVPIVKIADPGLAIVMNDEVRNDEARLWNLRLRGKVQYYQPEQFTKEWEYRAAIDIANLALESTAGNYNWWSNLYQIGWIMWSLVTHCFPPAPPRAWPYTYASEADGVVEDVRGFTYGMHIMATDYDDCDLELRRQILRCLDHDPTKRPKIGWLEAVCEFNVRRPDLVLAESDEQLQAHMNDIYGSP